MASVDEVYKLVLYRANKSGYGGYISPDDFNLLFPRAEVRYFNKLYELYGKSVRVDDALATFKEITALTIAGTGLVAIPDDLFHIYTLYYPFNGTPVEITRVEADRLANNLSSTYEAPSTEFPIYVENSTQIQFYPVTIATATLTYLRKPTTTKWAYTLNGALMFNTLVGGTGYTNGGYTNVPAIGGTGTGLTVNLSIIGGIITSVQVETPGSNYTVGDTLSVVDPGVIGAGTGLSFKVATISSNRPVYDPANSVDPEWSLIDLDNIIYQVLIDVGCNMRDSELEQFALNQEKTQV